MVQAFHRLHLNRNGVRTNHVPNQLWTKIIKPRCQILIGLRRDSVHLVATPEVAIVHISPVALIVAHLEAPASTHAKAFEHPAEDDFDDYVLGRLPEPELSRLEEHLLICELRREELDSVDALRFALITSKR